MTSASGNEAVGQDTEMFQENVTYGMALKDLIASLAKDIQTEAETMPAPYSFVICFPFPPLRAMMKVYQREV